MPPESTFTIPPEILVPELGAPLTRPGDPAYYCDASLVPPQQPAAALRLAPETVEALAEVVTFEKPAARGFPRTGTALFSDLTPDLPALVLFGVDVEIIVGSVAHAMERDGSVPFALQAKDVY